MSIGMLYVKIDMQFESNSQEIPAELVEDRSLMSCLA